MSDTKSVLVTGGAGFIGSHVCEAYLREGWTVTVLDNLSSGSRENVPEKADFIDMDIRDHDVGPILAERRFDLVNHHAAQMDVRRSVEDPRFDASVNVDGLLNLLQASVKSGVRRFVFVSSGGVVYGEPDQLPASEVAPKKPLSPYGVTKLVGEYYLYYYRMVHGLRYAALRYSNVFGPRQSPHGEAGVVSIFCRRVLDGTPITVYGDGEQTRDYVYVGDVARANMLVSTIDLADPTSIDDVAFNVGTGRETSVNELCRALMEVAGREVAVERQAERPGEVLRSLLDAEKLRKVGWKPEFELKAALSETYRYIENSEV
ncbi:MAG: NAD-dependent epimerase/dehydratase family protein [Gemmatimonadota bacterium]